MPDIIKVSYTRPDHAKESAGKLTRYLTYRREMVRGDDGRPRYRTIEATRGDPDEFRAAARERAAEGRRASYVHIIISPERSRDLEEDDLLGLVEPWVTDKNGSQIEHYAAVHLDGDRPHVHVAVARDKFVKRDLEARKEFTREIIREREMVRGIDNDQDRDLERERQHEAERQLEEERLREAERERQRQSARDRDRGRDDDLEMER